MARAKKSQRANQKNKQSGKQGRRTPAQKDQDSGQFQLSREQNQQGARRR